MELVVTDSYSKRKREELRPATGPDDATLVGSKAEDGMYYPVLDFDFPCRLYESETEGHYHFFVDKGMTWDDYKFLLQALHAAGLIEDGFLQSALQLEDTFVATKPWKGKK
jgi:hypothetical protein